MTREQYERWSKPYRNSKSKQRILITADKLITALIFLAYPVFLLYVFLEQSPKDFICAVAIPAVSFCLVSIFRKWYSAPRPYEVWNMKPLLNKDTKGKSFPSRHVFSVFIIGMTYFHTIKILGTVVFFLGAALAFIRVIGGVHFPKDVLAGAWIGILFGLLFWII